MVNLHYKPFFFVRLGLGTRCPVAQGVSGIVLALLCRVLPRTLLRKKSTPPLPRQPLTHRAACKRTDRRRGACNAAGTATAAAAKRRQTAARPPANARADLAHCAACSMLASARFAKASQLLVSGDSR
jgi:hypothetical protein